MKQLYERCADGISIRDRQQGEKSFLAGAVRTIDRNEQGLIVQVGSGHAAAQVSLDWSGAQAGEFRVYCTCRQFDGKGTCRHVVAAILAADADREAPNPPGNGRLFLRIDESKSARGGGDAAALFDDYADEFDDFKPSGRVADVISALISQGARPFDVLRGSARRGERQPPSWKTRLAELASYGAENRFAAPRDTNSAREIWYVLDLQASVGWAKPRISLFQRPIKKNGMPGVLKRLKLSQQEIDTLPSAEDRMLIELLAGNERESDDYGYTWHQYSKFVDFRIAPAMFDVVLPRLCASRRFGWLPDARYSNAGDVGVLDWDAGPPWTFRLTITRDEGEKNWVLSGRFERGEETCGLTAPLSILRSGLVVFSERLARFDARGHDGWLTMLRKGGDMLVPFKEGRQLVERLVQHVPASQISLPAELEWTEELVVPRPLLTISKARRSWDTDLECRLSFQYGEYTAPFGDGEGAWYDHSARRVVRRDRNAENAARDQLLASGARPHRYGAGDPDIHSLPPARMPGLAAALMEQGWRIEASGCLIRRPGAIQIEITSDVDWFDLRGRCDFEGVAAPLPKLLAAISRGEKFVVLDDGSQGVLPEEWLARYKALAGLGQAQGDALRFKPVQASLLDALLAAQESKRAIVDAGFARLRERLASFAGVQPCDPPQSFAGQLRDYQRVGLGWLRFLDEFGFGGCLADDMGLGKTIQVLALLEERRLGQAAGARVRSRSDGPAHAPSLVVVPRSLVFNWIEEARRFTPQLRVVNFTGLERNGHFERLHECDLVVTTYGTLRRDIGRLHEIEFDCAILDEAQAIKNASSQVAKACRLLKARRRLAMTGTPVENHLRELASLFEFLNPGMLGRQGKFDELFCSSSPAREANGKMAAGRKPDGNAELLGRALRPFLLRRTKRQVLTELPDKTEQTLYCELGRTERALYDELKEHYRRSLMGRVEAVGLARSKIQVLEALLRLRQASCHPGLLDKNRIDDGSAKLETLLEQIAEVADEGHKTLVFSQFTSFLSIVRCALDKQGVVYEYLDGKTRDRQARVERFQSDPNCRLFLISLKAGGQGLNLTSADYVYILDPWWNPAVEAQAVDRAHRIGQKRHVFAYRLIARDTVEEKILQLQDRKRGMAEAIISADNSLMTNLTAADLQMLLS